MYWKSTTSFIPFWLFGFSVIICSDGLPRSADIKKTKKPRSEAIDRWCHDKYDPIEQKPKLRSELIKLYPEIPPENLPDTHRSAAAERASMYLIIWIGFNSLI